MKVLNSKMMLCPCCMEEHKVKTVKINERTTFKKRKVSYDAIYMYCDIADELYMDEHQIVENDSRLKDAYRKIEGLLTSEEICGIRAKYGITQRDLSIVLGWGGKTITRYERHQVQDKAHDMILKKIDRDPDWFLLLLEEAKDALSDEAYQKYLKSASHEVDSKSESQLISDTKNEIDILRAENEWLRKENERLKLLVPV